MKVKFNFGIKSYSGRIDDIIFANFADKSVVLARKLPLKRKLTEQNKVIRERMKRISTLYSVISEGYKNDLTAYCREMNRLEKYKNQLNIGRFGIFTKMLWAAYKDSQNPLSLDDLSPDNLILGVYSQINTVSTAIENGYLPRVKSSRKFLNNIVS